MEQIFAFLYPLVAFFSVSAYLPQIVSLYRLESKSDDIALSSWFIWIGCNAVTLGYGLFCLKDTMFCMVTGVSLIMALIVAGLVVHNRFFRFGQVSRLRVRKQPPLGSIDI